MAWFMLLAARAASSATFRRHININGRPLFIRILREVTKYVMLPRRQWARDSADVCQYETGLLAAGPEGG
jgi:hypothetical protein